MLCLSIQMLYLFTLSGKFLAALDRTICTVTTRASKHINTPCITPCPKACQWGYVQCCFTTFCSWNETKWKKWASRGILHFIFLLHETSTFCSWFCVSTVYLSEIVVICAGSIHSKISILPCPSPRLANRSTT